MNIKTKYILAIIIAVTILFVTGVPLQATSDGRIKSSAKKSYIFRTYLKGDNIKVQSKDGKVTLTGTVSRESHSTMAEETLMGLPGVKSVDNQLAVKDAPASAFSDAWVGDRVRATLLLHRSVSYLNTGVSVADGMVILRGEASSQAQKQLTTEYVKDVSGVKNVDNQMTINDSPHESPRTKGEIIDDASITTQTRMSLLYHHGTDVFDTKVSTDKGVVTLTGTAKNQAEIDLATKLVNDIHGVEAVNNRMTIEVKQSSTN